MAGVAPTNISVCAGQEKQRQQFKLFIGKLPVLTVTCNQCVLSLIKIILTPDKKQACYELKQVPAKSGVIKVDEANLIAVNDQVLRRKIGVDDAVGAGRLCELTEIMIDGIAASD